ncbi:MAG TPA: caspase family protein [Acidimicrobiales bacterium]|nr:caspase family protein [Acidimicrobiales bacterium]
MATDDRAVVVGITRYPALGDLEGPENDAQAFVEWLRSPQGGDVPEKNVALVLSSGYDASNDPKRAEPTVVAVDRAFDELVELADERGGKAGRRLYVFMAGHGFAPDMRTAALLMANAAKGRTGYHVPGLLYADWFRQSGTFDEVVLFMDCCRERYPRAPLRPPPYDLLSATKPSRYFYGLATEWSRAARERPSGDKVRGLFSEALVAGLSGKARDERGAITGASLIKYLHNAVRKGDDPAQPLQEPEFMPTDNAAASIVFAEGVVAPNFRIRASLAAGDGVESVELFFGADLQHALPGAKVGAGWEWNVDRAGLYMLVRSGGEKRIIEVAREDTVDVRL